MSYQPEKSPARTLFVAGAMMVLVIAIGAIYLRSQKAKPPEPSLALFRQEVAALQLPTGSALESPAQESARIGSVVLANRYSVPQSGNDARAAFRAALGAHGWQYKSGSEDTQWIDTYCKPPLAAKVELVEDKGASSVVSLTLSWNEIALLTCGGVATR
jgi:hypothetical protein